MSLRTLFAFLLVFASTLAFSQSSLPPSWTYSSYFGGSNNDSISAQTRDSAGSIYVAGITSSSNFPTTSGSYEPTFPGPTGTSAIFVSKFSSTGSLVWSTFLGPGCGQYTVPSSIKVDSSGNVYVAGLFQCSGFPTTSGLPNSGADFVTKLNANGSQIIYSALLGGDIVANPSLVLDSANNAFVTGSGYCCASSQTGIIGPLGGIDDFWIAEINAAGNSLPWSVEIGGTGDDYANAITIDSSNKLYLTGYTASTDFPTTPGALVQPNGGRAFVIKVDPTQAPKSSLVYSALAGAPKNNANPYIEGMSIAVDASDNAYVGTWTYNVGLYTSPGAFQNSPPTTPNAYLFELNAAGSAIINGTYLGGGAADYIKSVGLDNSGNVYVSGFTSSWDFPVTAYSYVPPPFASQAYYVKLNPHWAAISVVEFGTPQGTEAFTAVPDLSQGLWLAGYSTNNFFTTSNAYQPTYQGGSDDGFLLHTNFAPLCSTSTVAICTIAADPHSAERIHFVSQAGNVEAAASLTLSIDSINVYSIHASQFDTWIPMAPGTHTAMVTFAQVGAASQKVQQSFKVGTSSACPVDPVNPSLTICNPLNAAVVGGTVSVTVEANDPAPPAKVTLFVDNKLAATVANQNGTYTTTLTLASGVHKLDATGTDPSRHALHARSFFRVQ